MTAIADRPAAFELRTGREGLPRAAVSQRFSLRPTEDGWSLLAPSGEVVFRGMGLASRRECLEVAHDLGALAVIS